MDSVAASPVSMDCFRVISLSIADAAVRANAASPRLHTEFERRISNDGKHALVKAHMVIEEENNAYYSVDLQAECQFGFYPGMSESDIDDYLSIIGATRLMDSMRQFLKQVTASFSLGPVSVPPLTPVIEWEKA